MKTKSILINLAKKLFVLFVLIVLSASVGLMAATRTFTNAGGDNLFSNPANWDGGVSIPLANDDIIISSGQTLYIDTDFTCASLQFMWTSSFTCTNGSTLTIMGNILDATGTTAIVVSSSIKVTSSLSIANASPS